MKFEDKIESKQIILKEFATKLKEKINQNIYLSKQCQRCNNMIMKYIDETLEEM